MRLRRRPIVIGLDLVLAALAALAMTIAMAGRFVVSVAGVRVSLGSPLRVLIGLGAVLLLRQVFDRHIGPLGVERERWRQLLWTSSEPAFRVRATRGAWRRTAAAAAGLAAALAVLLHNQVLHPDSVPDLGDPLFSMWRMGWVVHQLAVDPTHLFDTNIFYPERLTLTLSDPMILPALTGAPLVAIGLHPVVVYNLLLLSGFWLSGIATYVLVERLTGSPRAAFVAGLIYASYSYRLDHYSHLELQMTQWMPLGLLALHLFMSTGRWRYAIALGLFGVAQLYSSMYYAVFFLVFAVPIGAGLLLVHRPPLRRLALPLAVSAALAAALSAPLARAFADAQSVKGERGTGEVTNYSATPGDYFRAPRRSVMWGQRLPPPEPERALFPGAAPLALGVFGLVPPLGPLQALYGAGLLVALDGSLGLNGVWYPRLYRWLAPVRGLRAPARFGAIVGLTLAILAGFAVRRALHTFGPGASGHAVFAVLIVVVMIDAWPSLTLMPVWPTPPVIYAGLEGVPSVVLAEFPILPDETSNLPYMYFSLWHWSRMVNGYSGFIPRSYADFYRESRDFPSGDSIDALRKRGVTHVTVNCGIGYAGCLELKDNMRASPFLRLIAEDSWERWPVQVYEIAPPDPR